MSTIRFICPVCGYDRLPGPAEDYLICPSCGTEFGNDDFEYSHDELRSRWLDDGARWWSKTTPAPPAWDPIGQVMRVMISIHPVGGSTEIPTDLRVHPLRMQAAPSLRVRNRSTGGTTTASAAA